MIAGLLLIAAALFLTGYNLWDNYRAGKAANEALEQLAPLIEDDPVPIQGRTVVVQPSASENGVSDEMEYPDYVLNPNMDMPVVQIDGNDYIGVISIPAIDCELPVFSEWNYTNLKTSACRYTGSAYLDSMVICAHNYDNQFGSLRNLSYGDSVIFTDMGGNVFSYTVVEIEILQPAAIEEMITGDCDLTLFTCTVGGATRVAVRSAKADF